MNETALEEKLLSTPRGPVAYWLSRGQQDLTLVFLHDLLGDHLSFDVGPYSGKCNVLLWDAPAHGKSRPYTVFTYSYAAHDLHQILVKEGLSHVILIGQGFGASIAKAYLRAYPAEKLLVLEPRVFGPWYEKRFTARIWRSQWLCVCYSRSRLIRGILGHEFLPQDQRTRLTKAAEAYSKQELCRILTLGYVAFLKENQEIPLPCPGYLILREGAAPGAAAWAESRKIPKQITSDPGAALREALLKLLNHKKTV